ncbi:sulfide/dihydroorotate dehydrogenase-like FAD/NAD-binding protein [Candidatus Desulforudis audaxviator]|uniref:Oxidoreductase FAD/NAD(P)-binding domain protein n=1 Tax=Desulforudis audaxviator (strain MP104C) TaxID=477974 RepID=B1I242_DESAP|nr:sulfide/dihydroorotate dehydrogenase-like FAD/NAD-binding protein [Candidatus Desulforudis audaxviator]ACA59091.1 oxidoreductase FAD/NAD(P)-binding domain protein [Candidatus Desulforudis audaxviator MP104C]AZK59145.1 oxidoreductase FAD/NAD(P)-binding domain protein [Candidatus Desulforudis audaxviator]
MYRILRKEVFSPSVKLLEIEAPRVARKAQAGQFVMLRVYERGERIPLTVADCDPERGSVTVVFMEVGKTTRLLGSLEEGAGILDFVGPLGNPTEIEKFGRVACVGGGVGVACIYPICRALKKAGNEVIAVVGARTKELLFWEDRLRETVDELLITTDDGSYVRKGFVTDVLREVAGRENPPDRVVAVGPLPMMRAVCGVTKEFGLKTIVSLNPIMVDGIGMCGACRVTVGGETRFVCVEGPEFDGHEVDFAELAQRLQRYRAQEQESLARYEAGCGGRC